MTKPHIGEMIFFFVLFAAAGYFAFIIMHPYLTAIFLAGVLSLLFLPLLKRIEKVTKHRGVAALLTVLLVLVIILVPLSLLGMMMFDEVVSVYTSLSDSNIGLQVVAVWIEQLEKLIQHVIPTFSMNIDIYGYIETALTWVAQHLNTFFSQIVGFIFQLFLIVIAMFFLLRDGGKLRQFAVRWSPLQDRYDNSIISRLEASVTSVVKGALVTALAQGVLVGVGFTIFGVPNPVLWGTIASISALIPLVGTTIITIPAVIYLFAFSAPAQALGLLVWSLICVGLADNVLHPFLVTRGVHVHPFLILLSVFGGLAYFGPIGFIAGPVVMAFFFTLLDVYPSIMKGETIPGGDTK